MNKTEETTIKIGELISEIENSDANEYHKAKINSKLKDLTLLIMEAHIMIAKCKRVLIVNNLVYDDSEDGLKKTENDQD